jgi:predicted lipoprotein with Yx(FWY)xxD motif
VPSSVQISKVGKAFFLTDFRGQMLYTFARDGKTAACKAECMEVWPPLLAPALAGPVGEWTTVDRADGVRQWAYRGRLVYTFSEDTVALEAKGADAGGVWKTIPVTQRDAVDPVNIGE